MKRLVARPAGPYGHVIPHCGTYLVSYAVRRLLGLLISDVAAIVATATKPDYDDAVLQADVASFAAHLDDLGRQVYKDAAE